MIKNITKITLLISLLFFSIANADDFSWFSQIIPDMTTEDVLLNLFIRISTIGWINCGIFAVFVVNYFFFLPGGNRKVPISCWEFGSFGLGGINGVPNWSRRIIGGVWLNLGGGTKRVLGGILGIIGGDRSFNGGFLLFRLLCIPSGGFSLFRTCEVYLDPSQVCVLYYAPSSPLSGGTQFGGRTIKRKGARGHNENGRGRNL